MPNINDYKLFANGGGANVESQSQYVTDLNPGGSLQNGFQQGTAQSQQVNKVLRQVSMIAAAVAQTISDVLTIDVLDDGNFANFLANLKLAITNLAWTTGDVKLTYKTVADSGWILMNDGTIGDATSGATYANANAQTLYTLLWNNISQPSGNVDCTVVGGLGGSALADWNAHKKLTLSKALGRALALSGAGLGLTARNLGHADGNETHTLAQNELPNVTVGVSDVSDTNAAGEFGPVRSFAGPGNQKQSTSINGGVAQQAMDIMNPRSYMNAMIKL